MFLLSLLVLHYLFLLIISIADSAAVNMAVCDIQYKVYISCFSLLSGRIDKAQIVVKICFQTACVLSEPVVSVNYETEYTYPKLLLGLYKVISSIRMLCIGERHSW